MLSGRIPVASIDDPLYKAPNSHKSTDDLIHCRKALEIKFFGQSFADNIHIQVIYNILDIYKLLTTHINNIIIALSNLMRGELKNHEDLIGYLSWKSKNYEEFKGYCRGADKEGLLNTFKKLAALEQLGYYGIRVLLEAEGGKKQSTRSTPKEPGVLYVTEAEFYTMISSLGQIRQALAHGYESTIPSIFSIQRYGGQDVSDFVTHLYRERVDKLNASFVEMAKNDLAVLFKIFDVNDIKRKGEYVRDYYDFIISKEYKNQGFSIKLLRETMQYIIDDLNKVKSKEYDSVRYKVNRFFDFAIYRHYQENAAEKDKIIEQLRATLNEADKRLVYCQEARRIWPEMRDLLENHILPHITGKSYNMVVPDKDVSSAMLDGVLIPNDAHEFSKLIYMMTLFMDGKEINDLITTLINKMENIGSFLDVLKACKLKTEFTPNYGLFSESWDVAKELRTINSFARMRKADSKAKELMFVEAAKVLGDNSSEDELKEYFDNVLDTGRKGGKTSPGKEMGERNFIINNVINSPRFHYLARYANIENVSQLARSQRLLAFVLKEIPDAQIVRYYNACFALDKPFFEEMRTDLARKLTGFSFSDLHNIRNNDRKMTPREQEEKRSKQALVRLYLTVLYLAVKNLVYVNSRYFMAFQRVELDRLLLDPSKWDRRDLRGLQITNPDEYGWSAFAKDFLKRYPQKQRVQNYLNVNFANTDPWAISAFRNKVEHLDAVRSAAQYIADAGEFKSWFELYHYIMQRALIDQFDFDSKQGSKYSDSGERIISKERIKPKMIGYAKLVKRYNTYCRDAVKALCVPFAYNLPRYKNLTMDGLFDRNRPGNKGDGRITAEDVME